MEKIIKLSGRIDSTNASKTEEDILKELDGFTGCIIIDLENLEYISSAGLRVILKIKKLNKDTSIINCNSKIYNIMEMTGFTEMMNISKTLRKISVDGCPVIGNGSNGTVYRFDPETIVKVYNSRNSLEMIKEERELAKKAFVKGIPTAIPYDIVRVGNSYGSVFEMLNAKSFADLINEGEDLEKLIKDSVDLMKKFHSIKLNKNELPSKKNQQINKVKRCEEILPKDVGEKLLKLIEDIPEHNYMLHSDFQVKNILKQNGDILLIDMDTLSEGHPIFEFSAIYATYKGYSCLSKNNPSKFLGITTNQCEKISDLSFNYYFKGKTEDEIREIEKKAKIIAYLQVMYSQLNRLKDDKFDRRNAIEFCKNYIIDNIDKVDNLYFDLE